MKAGSEWPSSAWTRLADHPALLDRADRYIANPGGERERRRLLRALGDRQAAAVARLDQIKERQFEILFENGIVDESGRRIDDEPPAA